MARQRTAESTTKDIKGRTLPKFSEVTKRKWGTVRDLGARGNHITVSWDLDEFAHEKQIFELTFNGQKAYVSRQELEHYLRAV